MVPKDIILVSDSEILKIPIQDNGDVLVDIKDYPEIFTDDSEEDKNPLLFKLRKSVLEKLLEASRRLPTNTHFLVTEGYRPLYIQKEYFEEYRNKLLKMHPDWSKEHLYEEVSKYVASPDITPPHSTGGAVDLTLVDDSGSKLDMGVVENLSPEESKDACFTMADSISDTAKDNRKVLIDAMSKAGFVNYPTEYWHWSYGDRYWAYHKKQAFAVFGSCKK